jgi:hypothetical protein
MNESKKSIIGNTMSNKFGSPLISSKLIANNTAKLTFADDSEVIRLHHTDIIFRYKKGSKVIEELNTGGWNTRTTKERISQFSTLRQYNLAISSKLGAWYVMNRQNNWNTISRFYDGITFVNGRIKGKSLQSNEAKVKVIKAKIKKYCAKITKENLPMPDGGDCFYCAFMDKEGKQLDHLKSHIKEGYIHGSILVNAMREKGYGDMQIGVHYQMGIADTFRRAVNQYLTKRLVK